MDLRIKTLPGEATVNRVRLRCPRCGKDVYPSDKAMGLCDRIPKAGGCGSGPVEKTVDITVLRPGLLKLNGQWDAYWQKRGKELARLAA